VRLAGALRYFWDTRGLYAEGWARLGRALALHGARDRERLDALNGAGFAAFRLAYTLRSDEILVEAMALAQELGHVGGQAEALFGLASVRQRQGPDVYEPMFEQVLALARAAGDRQREVLALLDLGRVALVRGRTAQAQSRFLEGVELARDAGCVIETPTAIHHAGQCALELHDFDTARRLLDEALLQHRRVGNAHDAAQTLSLLGRLALHEQRLDEARALSAESLHMFRLLLDPKCSAFSAMDHANVLSAMGDGAAALPYAESATATSGELGFPFYLVRAFCTLGCTHATLGQSDAARRALFSGLVEQQRTERDTYLPVLLEATAELHPDSAVAPRLLGSAAALREHRNVPLLPHDRAEHERRHAEVRAKHPRAKFDRAFAAGRTLSREEAIESALALRPSS
jgi:tetratricopeptide (TPR) repeat protein